MKKHIIMKQIVLFLLFPFITFSQVSMSSTGSYTQDFNTLSSTGASNSWTDNSTIANWYWQKSTAGTLTYRADTGSSNSGAAYSYGSSGNSDRAMGSLGSGNASAGSFAWGVLLQNTSGATISDIKISYTGEQWRNSAAGSQTIGFYYKISSSTITSLNPNSNSTWTAVSALNFTSPITGGTAGALNGNSAANRTSISSISIPCLELKNNEYIMFKWDDPDHTGNDHGLSIDDVTVSWTTAPTCDATTNVALAGASISGLRNLCTEDASGWVYYTDKCNPGQLLFGIKKNGNTFDASVDITVGSSISKTSSNGANQEHGMFLMGRYWNVSLLSGSISSPVDIRFFYDPTELSTAKTNRDNSFTALPGTTLAVTNGNTAEWFKNTNAVPFDATYIASIVGNKFPSTYQKFPSPSTGTLNGVTYVELTGISSFSGGTGGFSYGAQSTGGTNALPVTWATVTATAEKEYNIIRWETASEIQSDYFELEYSTDGIHFVSIPSSRVEAKGTTAQWSKYYFLDKPQFEKTYYRIKQVDEEGLYEYSKTVFVKRNEFPTQALNFSMYPAEENNKWVVEEIGNISVGDDIQISIYDMMGRRCASQPMRLQKEIIDVSTLNVGSYIVEIQSGVQRFVQRMIK